MADAPLTYANRQLFPPKIPTWVRYAPVYVLLAVLVLPPFLTFLFYFYLPWEIFNKRTYVGILGFLVVVTCVSGLVVLIASFRAKERRIAASLLLLLNIVPFLLFGHLTPKFAEVFSHPILEKRVLAVERIRRIEFACLDYATYHSDAAGMHFPPHLATLIAAGKLTPEDLIDPFSTTRAMTVPPGLVESDWPRIAADVTAHSDFIYLGADWVGDRSFDARADKLILAYSKVAHFRTGPLISRRGLRNDFISEAEFSRLWAESNRLRSELLLPPLTLGGPPPAPPAPTKFLFPARPSEYQWRLNDRVFSPRMVALRNDILNYAAEHEGHYPPHLAALVAGHDIAPEDLLYPGSPTTRLELDLSKSTESDWPALAKQVEVHSDFIYVAGGFEDAVALEKWCGPAGSYLRPPKHDALLFYVRPLSATNPPFLCFHSQMEDELNLRYQALGITLREAILRTDETRAHFGLPPVRPNIVPEYTVPTPAILGAAKGADVAALHREISRRNALVIAAAILRARAELHYSPKLSADFQAILAGHYILPRHLHDPDSETPLADLRDPDCPRFPSGLFPTNTDDSWWGPAADHYVQAHSDYIPAYDVGSVAGNKSELLVYSKNDYGGTGRICAFADGTAVFVPGFQIH